MAKNYSAMAKEIIEHVGGEDNVLSVTHCMTRLRFKLKDESKVNLNALKKASGVIQVMVTAGQYQVVIGTDVGDVYDEIGKTTHIKLGGEVDEDGQAATGHKKGLMAMAIDTISGIFLPFMGAFMAAGLLKGILVLLTTLGVLSDASTTYTILYAAADGVFYFMPIFLGYTAAKKFGAEPFVAMAIAMSLVYPNLVNLYNAGDPVSFLGIPVSLINYTSSVVPIIVAVYAQSKLEKLIKPLLPQVVRNIFMPLISLVVIEVATLLIVGPITNFVANALANGIVTLLGICPPVAGFIFGLVYPPMIIFGLHWGFFPITMNNFATLGYDSVMTITYATNFAIAGCVLGIFFKTKNKDMKQLSASTFVSALVGGVTEPAIYGAVLKFKRPYVIVCILDAISGAIIATLGATQTAFLPTCILTVPTMVAMMGVSALIGSGIGLIGGAVLTYLFGYNDNMLE